VCVCVVPLGSQGRSHTLVINFPLVLHALCTYTAHAHAQSDTPPVTASQVCECDPHSMDRCKRRLVAAQPLYTGSSCWRWPYYLNPFIGARETNRGDALALFRCEYILCLPNVFSKVWTAVNASTVLSAVSGIF
jgi:hypothetical protein